MRGRAMYCEEIECREPCTDPDPLVWMCAREDGFWLCDECAHVNARLDDARSEALQEETVRRVPRRRGEVAA